MALMKTPTVFKMNSKELGKIVELIDSVEEFIEKDPKMAIHKIRKISAYFAGQKEILDRRKKQER